MSQTSGSTYPGKYGDWEKHAKLYEDGKHRRYELLFAVNGGAFAIGKLFVEHQQGADKFLKDLSLNQVAVGMIVFTIMMFIDILVFGLRMREDARETRKLAGDKHDSTRGTFSMWGLIVLTVVCFLIILAWFGVIGGTTLVAGWTNLIASLGLG